MNHNHERERLYMNAYIAVFAKGLAMGAANVIPGVSGGTIALITGIYERLINAIKQCDLNALKLFFSGKFSAMWTHVDGAWLSTLLLGVAISIITLARLFEFLLESYERYTLAFFFGLILLSIVYVARDIKQWGGSTIVSLMIGTAAAVAIATLAPASENDSLWYVFACGVVAISSMILPGLSGSFVLILMGNYALVLGAISAFNLSVLIPMALGCAFGLIAFSHILSWVFKRYADQTLALMTGFVTGSLVIIWPWKQATMVMVERAGKPPKEVIESYQWLLPSLNDTSTWLATGLMIMGALSIAAMDRFAKQR